MPDPMRLREVMSAQAEADVGPGHAILRKKERIKPNNYRGAAAMASSNRSLNFQLDEPETLSSSFTLFCPIHVYGENPFYIASITLCSGFKEER
jgi:hypothetical protein